LTRRAEKFNVDVTLSDFLISMELAR